jgi:hypothetical protein
MRGHDVRTQLRESLILATDSMLSRVEHCWIVVAGGPRRRREAQNVELASGRTKAEVLRDRSLRGEIWASFEEAVARGIDPAELAAAFDSATEETAILVGRELQRRRPQMLREHRAARRGLERRMRAIWGRALDDVFEVYVVAEEVGSELQTVHGSENDFLVEGLLRLHARGCLVLLEVHSLLSHGFPLGAWARTRSLYESAVIARVLADHGREAATDDLAERFLAHAVVDQAKDLDVAAKSGLEVDAGDLATVHKARADALARFGPGFGQSYGWARPLFPALSTREKVTFARLEEMAQTGLASMDYRYGGHHVHSSAWTVMLNIVSRAGQGCRLTGPTNVLLSEPAAVAMAAMISCTAATVQGVEDRPDPSHLLAVRLLEQLAERAENSLAEAQGHVDEREMRLQARLKDGT